MKVRDLLNLLKADGWYLVTTVGSQRQFKHPTKPGRVTIAGHGSDEVQRENTQQHPAPGGVEGVERLKLCATQ